MLRPIDQYFERMEEPARSCMQALRSALLRFDPHIAEAWKYRMPFYTYKGKMFCYLWTRKGSGQPYLGLVQGKMLTHPDLLSEGRKKMKILLVDPQQDLPLEQLYGILEMARTFTERIP
ncbi:DUF1801 domain-containing protein [Taibaiella koreensis]|uniref:DUF1801 domain-containing protein n=1 Tax=Taibaiella koreensis TaxID=1268548 RepID=UPI000E59DB43|nr:DUF1801 domain-containing protein [Taibaiella koreensis]